MTDLPVPETPATRQDLLGLPRERLASVLTGLIDKPYRVDQIYRALHEHGVEDFDQITTLSKDLRAALQRDFTIGLPQEASRHQSADGTLKYLFRLHDGATIETVDIPDGDRRTLCLSSQAGCALACRFCVTGFWGGGRNLTSGEIVAQVLTAKQRQVPDTHGLNLVFMGMGEPLLNIDNLHMALEILLEQISWRRVTISTAGILPGLEAMAAWPVRPQLAISLHAPDEDRRSEIMPINRKYPLKDLLPLLAQFPLARKQRITFEYILIRDFNDANRDADLLAQLLKGLPAKVNLIPLNSDPVLGEDMRSPEPQRVEGFRKRLLERGVMATTRRQRGDDISAACGQLRVPSRQPRGFRRSNLSL